MRGKREEGPWPIPSETPLSRNTGSLIVTRIPAPHPGARPWRGRPSAEEDEVCSAEEWPRTQTPHSDMFQGSHTIQSHHLKLPKWGRGPDLPPRAPPQPPSTPLPARAAPRPAAGAAAATALRAHRRIRTSGPLVRALSGPPGPRPAPGPLRGRADLPRCRLRARSSEQPGSEQPPMPGEGRAGHRRRGKGAREGGTKERRRGRGSDGGEERGAGWRGRGGAGGCGEGASSGFRSPGQGRSGAGRKGSREMTRRGKGER